MADISLRRAVAAGLSTAVLILLAACSPGGKSAGSGGSADTSLTCRQPSLHPRLPRHYDSNSDSIEVFLFQFSTPADATVFKTGSLSVAPGKPKADLFIPGAEEYDATSPSQGMYDHGVIAIKGNYVFVIDEATGSSAPVPLVKAMARQQYAAL
jgi:ABC-type cobalt transport system substrate-binding protein